MFRHREAVVMPSRWDVVILGGGPAGVSVVLALRQTEPGLRVLMIEAAAAPTWRIGETLAPGAKQLLVGLGCWDAVARDGMQEAVRSLACWGSDQPHGHEFIFSLRGNAWHVDRARFDESLRMTADAAGITIWRGARFLAATRDAGVGWWLTIARDDGPVQVAAEFVVDATGRGAKFAVTQGSRHCFDDRLIGIAAVVALRKPAAIDNATLVEACADGWWYSSMIPGHRLVLAWMSDSDIVHHSGVAQLAPWLDQLQATQATRARAGGAEPPDRLSTWSARSHCLDKVCGSRWLAVGDAASSWDPLSSAGIMKALRGGKLGAFALLDAIRGVTSGGDKYGRIIEAEHTRYLQDRRLVYGQEQRWPDAPFWARRHRDEPVDVAAGPLMSMSLR
jgi:flavin-dependent dehydrogenase